MQRLDRLANLGMLSAGMAHEIKNGMVAIKTFVDLLLEKNQDAELGDVVRHELERINAHRDADAADGRARPRQTSKPCASMRCWIIRCACCSRRSARN